MYLSPGGLRGFYTHGICKFIRYNYDLSNYTYYGASAGAWNSLYMSVKPNKESLNLYCYHPKLQCVENAICTIYK